MSKVNDYHYESPSLEGVDWDKALGFEDLGNKKNFKSDQNHYSDYSKKSNNSNGYKNSKYSNKSNNKKKNSSNYGKKESFEFRGFKNSKQGEHFSDYERAGNNLFARDILRSDSQDKRHLGFLSTAASMHAAEAAADAVIIPSVIDSVTGVAKKIYDTIAKVVHSVTEMVSNVAQSISEKRQKFFEFAFSDSKHYYNAYVSNEAIKYAYKDQQKQRKHERKLRRRDQKFIKSYTKKHRG